MNWPKLILYLQLVKCLINMGCFQMDKDRWTPWDLTPRLCFVGYMAGWISNMYQHFYRKQEQNTHINRWRLPESCSLACKVFQQLFPKKSYAERQKQESFSSRLCKASQGIRWKLSLLIAKQRTKQCWIWGVVSKVVGILPGLWDFNTFAMQEKELPQHFCG